MSAAFRIFLCFSSPQHHHQHRLTTLFMVTKPHHTCMTKHAHTHKILSPSVAGYWNDVASARLRLDAADFWIAARLTTDLRNTNAMESAWHISVCQDLRHNYARFIATLVEWARWRLCKSPTSPPPPPSPFGFQFCGTFLLKQQNFMIARSLEYAFKTAKFG